ncbi:hypothetical protein AK812_SmicGene46559, partial [Symbiodinium microadriaticum]
MVLGSKGPLTGEEAWYVSSAFSPWEPTASVCETLGCE